MSVTDLRSFKAHVESRPGGVFVISGSQPFLISSAVSLIEKKLDDPELITFASPGANAVQTIFDAIVQAGFFARPKLVTINSPDIEKFAQSDFDVILSALEAAGGDIAVVFVFEKQPAGKKAKQLLAIAQKSGCVCVFETPERADLVRFCQREAQAGGAAISPHTASVLIERCGEEMHNLKSQIAKLAAYAQGGEITTQAVELLTAREPTGGAFDLAKAVLRGDARAALSILSDLFAMRVSPVAITGALASNYIDILRAHLALESGKGQGDVTAAFALKGREFRVRNAFREAQNTSAVQTKQAIGLILDCDRRLKSTSTEDRLLLELLITRLISIRKGAGQR